MGINKFKEVLEKNCPHVLQTKPISFFRGYRVSIDASIVMIDTMRYPWKQATNNKHIEHEADLDIFYRAWSCKLLNVINKFLTAGITPVFVFDGKAPPEKSITRKKRHAQVEKNRNRYNDLLKRFNEAPAIEKVLIMQEAQKIRSYLLPVGKDSTDFFKQLLYIIGIPFLQAREEADNLCATLCIDGYCYAQYTTDTDSLAHGCRCVIKGFADTSINEKGQIVEMVQVMELSNVLQGLNLSYKSFVDMCIMLGCDYNSNIPDVGPAKVVPLIAKYRCIECLPAAYRKIQLDTSILKHEPSDDHRGCRNMFSYRSIDELIVDKLPSLDLNGKDITVRLAHSSLNIQLDLSNTLKIINFVPPAKNVPPGKDDLMIDSAGRVNFIICPYLQEG